MLLMLPITFNLEFIMNIQDYQQARLSRDPRFDGVFFTAVKTTSIYCKPSCSAKKPNRENVIFYDTKNLLFFNISLKTKTPFERLLYNYQMNT